MCIILKILLNSLYCLNFLAEVSFSVERIQNFSACEPAIVCVLIFGKNTLWYLADVVVLQSLHLDQVLLPQLHYHQPQQQRHHHYHRHHHLVQLRVEECLRHLLLCRLMLPSGSEWVRSVCSIVIISQLPNKFHRHFAIPVEYVISWIH